MPRRSPMLRISSIAIACALCYCIIIKATQAKQSPISQLSAEEYANGERRAADAAQRVMPPLKAELKSRGLEWGAPVFIRIFKQSRELELWLEDPQKKHFTLFKTYPIAGMSGNLGPKRAEGDKQAPEGCYAVSKRLMNPTSRYHLSFNLGYPNQYDQFHKRTGSAIMIHGNTLSIGCFAMTDEKIEEIYTLCDAALDHGQPFFRVHCFPFPLTEQNLRQHQDSEWHSFWKELQPGFQHFETHKRPPNAIMDNGKYNFESE